MKDPTKHKPSEQQKICFVVMGYGTKIAYDKNHKPRKLNLDATYNAIIEPAVTAAGLRCVRSDKMLNKGMIDTKMYEMLLRADVVVADISTGNVNAVYELGVRHALRPYTTIVMQESEAVFHFDLAHLATFTYKHLGDDVGASEAKDKSAALTELIREALNPPTRDSPVYEFLPNLREPEMSPEDYEKMLTVIEDKGDGLAQFIVDGREAMKAANFVAAIEAFTKARDIIERKPTGEDEEETAGQSELPFVINQLALATYKSKQPSEREALNAGLRIIAALSPDVSQDTETLGIAGAMHKRIWLLDKSRDHLDRAIEFYGRGFNLQKDYYNGENYATCLDMRSDVQEDKDDALYDRMAAKKARKDIVKSLEVAFAVDDRAERSDRLWMHATMANTLFALGHGKEAEEHETKFRKLAEAPWQIETYGLGKKQILERFSEGS